MQLGEPLPDDLSSNNHTENPLKRSWLQFSASWPLNSQVIHLPILTMLHPYLAVPLSVLEDWDTTFLTLSKQHELNHHPNALISLNKHYYLKQKKNNLCYKNSWG